MPTLKNPEWIKEYDFRYDRFEDIPQEVFDRINERLDKVQSDNPLVSVVIPAWNEETSLLRTIASLSGSKTRYPFEIVVINNNSTDRTQDTLDHLHVQTFFQPIQGWGPARQMGLEKARGKYILTADADSLYPERWIDEMMQVLLQPGVVCAYGRYSFIGEKGFPRWKLYLLERMKDVIAEVRHYKRPFLNAYGISMGYVREKALEIGFVMHKIRGEDGRMCFDLMQHGKIRQVKSNAARPWTSPRTLRLDGNFEKALWVRVTRELKRLHKMLVPMPPHDTKTSPNVD